MIVTAAQPWAPTVSDGSTAGLIETPPKANKSTTALSRFL